MFYIVQNYRYLKKVQNVQLQILQNFTFPTWSSNVYVLFSTVLFSQQQQQKDRIFSSE